MVAPINPSAFAKYIEPVLVFREVCDGLSVTSPLAETVLRCASWRSRRKWDTSTEESLVMGTLGETNDRVSVRRYVIHHGVDISCTGL